MSHTSSSKIHKYDAFLSFRGEDIRRTFVSHLYNALIQRRIDVFKDDERLETGKSIHDELPKAIEESKFAIVIFSESYASSKWCLEELAHIIKCRKELDQIVIPIFYNVKPSDVSHQNPPFAESFSEHEKKYKDDMEKIQRWRDAFAVSGKISGYHLQNYKDEADCIKKVVDKLISLLHIESDEDDDEISSVGIRGMGAKSPILIDGGKMSISSDKKTGKKCFMIAARALDIEWSNNPDYWEWLSHSDSRFVEVAKLKWVCWLDIRGKIETRRLSKRTKYVAYLVFKLENKFHGLETVNAVVRFVDSMSVKEAERRASVVHFSGQGPRETLPFKRGDGWMELKMGDFFNDAGEDGDVDARLMETEHLEAKGGLIVQGVEFRPQ
ncbi:TMV resistance protein N-like [Solanum dulcamara]|uniref:TMV resistance protein N-like n=1 Tax=Solanum dulcamara TaxID=45834 RepID=UPI00248540FF|nr:TMV resistance protein N-like [Solanum dulcamara]